MRKIAVSIAVHLCLIFTCFSISAQEFKTIQSGIEYAEMTSEIDSAPVKINLLRLDLTKVRLDAVHAMDAAIGTETVSSMAKRYGAFAAINGGFFRLDKSIFAGEETGVLFIDDRLYSESFIGRTELRISNKKNKTEVEFSRTKVIPTAILDGKELNISGINRKRKTHAEKLQLRV